MGPDKLPSFWFKDFGPGLLSKDEGYKDTKDPCLDLHLESDENTGCRV